MQSLDGSDVELYPYFDYLLQDLLELGASAEVINSLIKKHIIDKINRVNVLDLGCGKGAVSISIAKEFGFRVIGIDAYTPFIKEAKKRAKEFDVENFALSRLEI